MQGPSRVWLPPPHIPASMGLTSVVAVLKLFPEEDRMTLELGL